MDYDTKRTQPYSIYVRTRPLKIAFLVSNEQGGLRWVDRIIDYNRRIWGGRFNPIILTDGKTIDDNWMTFLRRYDPDYLCSTLPLEDELQTDLYASIAPITSIEFALEDNTRIHLRNRPISILPSKSSIRQVSHSFFDDEYPLIQFELSHDAPPAIEAFLFRNFGILQTIESMDYYLRRSIGTCKIEKYAIQDFQSLNNALEQLAEYKWVVFPSQICSIPNQNKDVQSSRQNRAFSLFVGDSVLDVATYWNWSQSLAQWQRDKISHIWISEEIIKNPAIQPGLTKFVALHASRYGDQSQTELRITSSSISEDELRSLSKPLGWPQELTIYDSKSAPEIPVYRSIYSYFQIDADSELYRAHSDKEIISIMEPISTTDGFANQCYIADIDIQYRPERYSSFYAAHYWWLLPKRYSMPNFLNMFRNEEMIFEARVNEHGSFSVLMRKCSEYNPKNNRLTITIPSEESVFRFLLCGTHHQTKTQEGPSKTTQRPFIEFVHSNAGHYLYGLLRLFPDLYAAYALVFDSYWRRIFKEYANFDLTRESEILEGTENKLRKILPVRQPISDDKIEHLARQVLRVAKNLRNSKKYLKYGRLKEIAEKEHFNYLEKHPDIRREFNETSLKDYLSHLLSLDILQLGIAPKCLNCGSRIWTHLDEIRQRHNCQGCGFEFTLSAEEDWCYRLNSLVLSGFYGQGLMPVILVLGQLLKNSVSFIFVPNLDLYDEYNPNNNPTPSAEIDVVCIRNGKFIIGEVKESVSHFGQAEFNKMEDIAMRTKPDQVIFSALSEQPSEDVKQKIKELSDKLKPYGIDVNWFQLEPEIFTPQAFI